MAYSMSEEKEKELKEAFTLFEKDGDGTINACDLGTVMRALALNPTEADIAAMMKEINSDGNGKIDFEEFKTIMAGKLTDYNPEDEIRNAFKVFDKEGSGVISTAEMRTVLTTLGEVMSPEEVDELIREADTDGGGMIHYDGFISMLLQS